jgi:hypothetical protein
MKRSFQCAFGAAALLLSSSAWAQDFSAKGQLAISAERLFGFYHDSATLDGTTFKSDDSFLFAPRVGYMFAFTSIVGIWPRGGFTYRTLSAGDTSQHDLALTLEAPFVFTVIPHVAFWAGPTLDVGLSGSQSAPLPGGATRSVDLNATEIGIQTGLVGYVDL